jgi:hypothetical protein
VEASAVARRLAKRDVLGRVVGSFPLLLPFTVPRGSNDERHENTKSLDDNVLGAVPVRVMVLPEANVRTVEDEPDIIDCT